MLKKRGMCLKGYLVLFLFTFTFIFLVGCKEKEELSENATIAKNYLISEGYEVISHQGDGWQEFSKSDLHDLPNQQVWAVQYNEPDEYLNKRIDTVTFTIKNHPLDELFNMGKTTLTVWLYDSEVIGGWSYPISKDNDVVGGPSSLDGKAAEEIQGDYQKWLEEWQDKYGS
jgi:hypothetical protein